jgi:hypothetical protein
MATAHKIGLPLTWSDLDIKPVPAEQNAASIYARAEQLIKESPVESKALALAEQPAATTTQKLGADSAIQGLGNYFAELSSVETRPKCNFDRDWNKGAALIFPELSGLKRDVRDLCYKADYQDRTGDLPGALDTMGTAFRIASDSGTDPVVIGMLVENAGRSNIDKEWESLIQHHSNDQVSLASISKRLSSETQLPQMRRYLAGEVVFGLRTIETLNNLSDLGLQTGSTTVQQAMLQSPLGRNIFKAKYIEAWNKTWSNLPSDPNDWRGYSNAMSKMMSDLENDHSIENSFNQIVMPTFTQAADTIGTLQATQNLLETSIALLKIRKQTGKLPLVLPPSLENSAVDPFDGDLLRYRRKGMGFLLYSVGLNGVDDGGIPSNTTNTRADDVVVEML